MYELAKKLWPLNRSLTGKDTLKSLKILKECTFNLKIKFFNSGTKCFDWIVPDEWKVTEAWIKNSKGLKIIDFKKNNLHLVGYSSPVNKKLNLIDLKKKIYSIKNKPKAIPYVTSYYKRDWGFCMNYNQFRKLKKDEYKVFINSDFKKGKMNYGEILIKGKSSKEILISTYICHPSMANNELSGPVVAASLSQWLNKLSNKYSYRILFLPETIGSIAYISRNLKKLKKKTYAGFVLTCVGDERNYSYIPSRYGNTISDKVSLNFLNFKIKKYKKYSWLDRGSDERQYCSPGVDLPICSIMRTRYGSYPEYHTSEDKLGSVVTKKGLEQSLDMYKSIITTIENNVYYKSKYYCEPNLGKRNLYSTISKHGSYVPKFKIFKDILSYCDGKNDVIDIANFLKVSAIETLYVFDKLKKNGLIVEKKLIIE